MITTDEHFRLLVERVEEYAIFLLDPDGIVQSWNAGAQRIKGYTADEIVGQHFSKFYTTSDLAVGLPTRAIASARESSVFEDVGWRVRKDGTQFWASVVITAVRDERGALVGFAKVTRDLTDRAYRRFIEASNSVVWTADGSGRANADSPSWRAFTGQTVEQWRDGHGWDPVHPDDQGVVREAWPRAKAARAPFVAEFRLRRHDGEYVWMSCRALPFLNPDGTVREWFGVNVDITARKRAEDERARANEWWETTLRSLGDGVIATDATGLVTFMNPEAERLTAWTLAEARGCALETVFPIVDEETRAVIENPAMRVLREGAFVSPSNQTILLGKDGVARPIDDSASPIRRPDGELDGVVLVFRDAAHEKQEVARKAFLARAGEMLIAADDYRDALSKIVHLAVPRLADWCAVDVADPADGIVRRVSVAHVDPSKVESAHRLEERYPPDPNAPTGVPNVLRTGKSELYKEIPFELLDEAAVDEEHHKIIHTLDLRSAMIVPLNGHEKTFGALSFVYCGSRRYTEEDLAFAEELARRAALVVERRRLEEEAKQANATKDLFLAMLGHELRNPLAPIRTALEVMQMRDDPSTSRECAVIERQVNHLVRLVDDLLDVSRITRSKLELARAPVEISVALARALELASPLVEKRGHVVELAVPETGLLVNGDPARLAQVFGNLLTNAAKYTNTNGRIDVRATREGGEVVVAITDNGIGIAPEMLGAIFEMFIQERQSIARSQGGLGLGLSLARSITAMHGGSLTAHSAGRGHGSTFVVRLPVLDTAEATAKNPTPESFPAIQQRRVLLVDDNEDALFLLEQLVATLGHDVRTAVDGPQAIELVRVWEPDIAICDIGLPGMSGYELAGKLRELSATVKLVALSGYGQESDRVRSHEAGFERHLVKPISAATLKRSLEELGS